MMALKTGVVVALALVHPTWAALETPEAAVPASAAATAPAEDLSKAALCPTTGEVMDRVVPIAPLCFKNCPALCGPMEHMMVTYWTTEDKNKARREIKKGYCSNIEEWDCLFKDENYGECVKLLQTGKSLEGPEGLGTDPPMTEKEMETKCAAKDASPEDTDSDGAQQSVAVSAAAGALCVVLASLSL